MAAPTRRDPILAGWLLLAVAALVTHWFPVRFGLVRLAVVLELVLLVAGGWWLAGRRRGGRTAVTALVAMALGLLLGPGRAHEPAALRRAYVDALLRYDGVRYVWGGETHTGIDCSGLVRCGLIDACWREGLRTANPALIRRALSLWWHDGSAHAMTEGYGGRMRGLGPAPSLNALDPATVAPGDLATAGGGVHVLAYLGDRTWIQADPNLATGDRVIRVRTPSRNAWCHGPVVLLRWRLLD